MYKIVIADYYYPNTHNEETVFSAHGNELEIVDLTKVRSGGIKDADSLLPYVADADALIVQFADVNEKVIAHMDKCKVISRYAIGVDNIDIKAASAKGIYVANVPDYCIDEVSDTAVAHILCAMRRIAVSRDMLLKDEFELTKLRPIRRMRKQTLGLLGFGHIARSVMRKTKEMFGHIVVYDPYFTATEEYPDITFGSLDMVLAESDVLSIHVPLSPSTKNMFSSEQFDKMKKGMVIVNTARGGLIDEQALLKAIQNGCVSYCGLDVIATEDFANSELLHDPHIVLTPHMAWCSEEAIDELQTKVAENVVTTLFKGEPVYCVNRSEVQAAY